MNNLTQLKQLSPALSILYVEDDLHLQNKLLHHLKHLFAKFFQAYDGTDGFDQYIKEKPNLIITDLTLSRKNSFEMIMDIKEIDESIDIIVLSEIDDNFELLESLDIRNIHLLIKPLNLTTLYQVLTKIVLTNFQESISKKCKIFFNSIVTNKYTLQCFNNYKGIVLHNEANLLFYKDNMLKIKVNHTQSIAALYEKQIILNHGNIYILCKLIDINEKLFILTLNDPQIIQYNKREHFNKRIIADQNFKTTINFKNTLIEMEAFDISLNFITLKNSQDLELQISDTINLTIGFEIDGPSSLVIEKKFVKIFAKGKIVRVDTFATYQKIVVALEVKKAGQNVFKNYLQQREIAIINELKRKIKK